MYVSVTLVGGDNVLMAACLFVFLFVNSIAL